VYRAEALGDGYKRLFIRELNFIIHIRPRYSWGGASEDLSKGMDCSGFMFRAAKWAGMPVRRTTSRRMAMGEGGWIGRRIDWKQRQVTDLVFWTFKRERPNGHVGVILKDKNHCAHASGSRNQVVVDKFNGVLRNDLSGIKRLTIGDQ
jgi:cell wall-associated NlpC family hydrolase